MGRGCLFTGSVDILPPTPVVPLCPLPLPMIPFEPLVGGGGCVICVCLSDEEEEEGGGVEGGDCITFIGASMSPPSCSSSSSSSSSVSSKRNCCCCCCCCSLISFLCMLCFPGKSPSKALFHQDEAFTFVFLLDLLVDARMHHMRYATCTSVTGIHRKNGTFTTRIHTDCTVFRSLDR